MGEQGSSTACAPVCGFCWQHVGFVEDDYHEVCRDFPDD